MCKDGQMGKDAHKVNRLNRRLHQMAEKVSQN